MHNRIVQGLWIGKHLSRMELLCISSYLANGHDFHLYAYDKIDNVPPRVIVKDANAILSRDRIYTYEMKFFKGGFSGFANLFRYKLLLDKGGIWTDMDMVCLKPMDFKQAYVFCSEYFPEDEKGAFRKCNPCLTKTPPGSKIMEACFQKASNETDRSTFGKTGPVLFNAEIKKFGLEEFILPPEAFCPVNWWDWQSLLETGRRFVPGPETYGIHLWNEMWRRQSLLFGRRKIFSFLTNKIKYDRNRHFPDNTILGQLQRRYNI